MGLTFYALRLGQNGPNMPNGPIKHNMPISNTKKNTTAWYCLYHTVVLSVPRRGIHSTTLWYSQYHAVVLTLIKSIVCLNFLKGGFLSRGDDVLALAFLL